MTKPRESSKMSRKEHRMKQVTKGDVFDARQIAKFRKNRARIVAAFGGKSC